MSYDLDVLRGDIDTEEGSRPPLDPVPLPEQVDLGALVATLLPVRIGGALRTVGVTVTSSGGATVEERRSAYRQLLGVLMPLAEQLGARVYDHQLDDWLDPADIEGAATAYA